MKYVAVSLCLLLLSGCGYVNSKLSAGAADLLPVWAGGEPKDVPPRPGTSEYDAWMNQRAKEAQPPKAAPSSPAGGPTEAPH